MLCTHDSHSIGSQQLLRGHGGEVGDVGERVNTGHQWNGDVNGTREVPDEAIDRRHMHGGGQRATLTLLFSLL